MTYIVETLFLFNNENKSTTQKKESSHLDSIELLNLEIRFLHQQFPFNFTDVSVSNQVNQKYVQMEIEKHFLFDRKMRQIKETNQGPAFRCNRFVLII